MTPKVSSSSVFEGLFCKNKDIKIYTDDKRDKRIQARKEYEDGNSEGIDYRVTRMDFRNLWMERACTRTS